MMPLLVGTTGLVTEYGYGMLRKAETQRVADVAAFSGAVAYNTALDNSATASQSATAMTSAALGLAAINAVSASNVVVSLVDSPSANGNKAVSVTIKDQVPLIFSRLIAPSASLGVASNAVVELVTAAGPCVTSLQAVVGPLTAGIGIDGGTVINALLCAVSANAAVTVPCGTGINTARLTFNGTLPPDQPCNGVQAPVGQVLNLLRKQVVDPYSADASITGAQARVVQTGLQLLVPPPVVVAVLPPAISFAGSVLTTTVANAKTAGCTAALTGKVWNVTACGATVTLASISVAAGYSVNFNTAGAATTVYNIAGEISSSGDALSFGPGVFNVAGGIRNLGSGSMTFTGGALNLGFGLLSTCSDGTAYSLCNKGRFTASGPVSVTASNGIYNAAAATMTLGSGSGNSYRIGKALLGSAMRLAVGSTTMLGNGIGDYLFAGDIAMDAGSGSCLVIGSAPNHDINGSLRTAGATVLGGGTYTVTGAVLLGVNGAADAMCNGTSQGVAASGVTFVVGGGLGVPLSGPCALEAFCVAPGYNNVVVTAPTSGLLAKVAVIGPALNASGALFSSGLSNTSLSGLFYVPLGLVDISGGVGVGSGLGQCLELVVGQLLVHHSSIFAAPCKSSGPAIRSARLVA